MAGEITTTRPQRLVWLAVTVAAAATLSLAWSLTSSRDAPPPVIVPKPAVVSETSDTARSPRQQPSIAPAAEQMTRESEPAGRTEVVSHAPASIRVVDDHGVPIAGAAVMFSVGPGHERPRDEIRTVDDRGFAAPSERFLRLARRQSISRCAAVVRGPLTSLRLFELPLADPDAPALDLVVTDCVRVQVAFDGLPDALLRGAEVRVSARDTPSRYIVNRANTVQDPFELLGLSSVLETVVPESGALTLPCAERGAALTFRIVVAHGDATWLALGTVPLGAPTLSIIRLAPPREPVGLITLTRPEGSTLGSTRVRVLPRHRTETGVVVKGVAVETQTDTDGRLALTVRADATEFGLTLASVETPVLVARSRERRPSQGPFDLGTYAMQAATRLASGTVRGTDGAPLAGARIAIRTTITGLDDVEAGPAGTFAVSGVATTSTLVLEVRHRGHLSETLTVPTGSDSVDVVLHEHVSMGGTLSPEIRHHLGAVEFAAVDQATGRVLETHVCRPFSGRMGHYGFAIPPLRAGTFRVIARFCDGGSVVWSSQPHTLEAGERVSVGVVHFSLSSGLLAFEVIDAAGNPVKKAEARITANGHSHIVMVRDGRGSTFVPTRTVAVTIHSSDYGHTEFDDVAHGAILTLPPKRAANPPRADPAPREFSEVETLGR